MCDYSLHHVANRPAKIEDKLVATKFHSSITRGFAAVGQPNVAVCLLPGTEIAFDESVECEPSFGIGILPNKKIGQRLARLAAKVQVVCVTHAPQVAARADRHYVISKDTLARGKRVATSVTEVAADRRREEIARMLAGAEITDEARKAAARLIKAAN